MAQYIELDIDQGADFSFDFTVTDADGSPTDVTDYTFVGSIRKSTYSLYETAAFDITIVDPFLGLVAVGLSANNTAVIKAGRYMFDVKQTDPNNIITRIVEGIVTVNPQVTRG